jgi:hypothetical protein
LIGSFKSVVLHLQSSSSFISQRRDAKLSLRISQFTYSVSIDQQQHVSVLLAFDDGAINSQCFKIARRPRRSWANSSSRSSADCRCRRPIVGQVERLGEYCLAQLLTASNRNRHSSTCWLQINKQYANRST